MRFHSGRMVEYEDCDRCHGDGRVEQPGRLAHEDVEWQTCPRCGGAKVRLAVTGLAGGKSRYRIDKMGEVERAYRMALDGPPRKPQPQSKRDFGDDPPF